MNSNLVIRPLPASSRDEVWDTFVDAATHDDGRAARDHLAAGRPVYYIERNTPRGLLVKSHPNGRRELVRFDAAGDEVIAPIA